MSVSKLEIVPVRDAFPHEAHSFTLWLESNIDALADRVGFELTVLEREKAVGSFNVDLFCEDQDGQHVIIENQLERSDHDHLGKLLTYMVNLDAKTAIWVTPEARPEHQRVIDWLNESTGADYAFYLVRVEAVRIAESPYAPLFTVLAAPDEQTREIGEAKKELAEGEKKYLAFWTSLLDRSKGKTELFSSISPGRQNWISMGAGKSGLVFAYVFAKNVVQLEFYIDTISKDQNKAIFDALHSLKDQIETEFGEELGWQRLDQRRACRIRYEVGPRDVLDDPEAWPESQDKMINAMIRFAQLFKKRIPTLPA